MKLGLMAMLALLLLALLVLGAFPVGLLRGTVERRLASAFDAPVELGEISRDGLFSFTPEITLHDMRMSQPDWAGEGDFVRVERASAHIPVLSVLTGNVVLRSLHISGMELALVRDEEGNSNWAGPADRQQDDNRNPLRLQELTVSNSRFSLSDAKRRLELAGSLAATGSDGPVITARGSFHDSPAQLTVRGDRLTGGTSSADWPFAARLVSDPLDLSATGTMAGALNVTEMDIEMEARGSSLKMLDDIIEAGLFGTQDIDLTARVRRRDADWFIDELNGSIGRSQISGEASILRRGGRSKIDATLEAPRFDLDDLSDDAGQAEAAALEARIGPRVIPATRIDLSNMGPTDGIIRFRIERLLVKGGSAFRSLSGELTLDHRVLRLDKAIAGLESGRVTGWVEVDSTEETPVLSTELRVEGSSLDTLVGDPDMISGPLRGLVRITGRGTTIREAFASGSGKVAFVSSEGTMNRIAAFVLGQDLGGTIGQALRDSDAKVPLRCAILAFEAVDGVLRPAPLELETGVSNGRGTGRINMDGETITITLNGVSKGGAALELVDPVRVGGTLSSPAISIDDRPLEEAGSGGGVLRSIGRSIGSALGLRGDDERDDEQLEPDNMNCDELTSRALQ